MNDNLEIIDKKNIVALIKELQYLNDDVLSKFNGESDKEGNLLEKLTYFNNNLIFFLNENKQLIKEANVAKQELSILFQKLQDSKNLKLEIQSLKLDFVSKKEFDELIVLIQFIKDFKKQGIGQTNQDTKAGHIQDDKNKVFQCNHWGNIGKQQKNKIRNNQAHC